MAGNGRGIVSCAHSGDDSDRVAIVNVEIRPARADDERALTRLAQRDSARVPPAPLLVGVQGGELGAAISLATGAAIADPFAPTARLVELLRTHAAPIQQRPSTRSDFRLILRRAMA